MNALPQLLAAHRPAVCRFGGVVWCSITGVLPGDAAQALGKATRGLAALRKMGRNPAPSAT
jgi:hypothetical protein